MSDWSAAIKEMRKILLAMNSPGMDAEWRDACRTALSEIDKLKRPAPLDGWVLVPREPTAMMLQATQKTNNTHFLDKWRAAIAAAPSPEKTEGERR